MFSALSVLVVTTLENSELQKIMNEAHSSNGAFYDTAERYGNHMKTAFGMGWGETENLLNKFGKRVTLASTDPCNTNAIIATKFTPSPWRTSVESVVEACEQSRLRLGVDQIDL